MTQSEVFQSFMLATWRGGDESPLDYDLFYDAVTVATTLGGKPSAEPDDEGWCEWLFPDGSHCSIVIDDDRVGYGTTP